MVVEEEEQQVQPQLKEEEEEDKMDDSRVWSQREREKRLLSVCSKQFRRNWTFRGCDVNVAQIYWLHFTCPSVKESTENIWTKLQSDTFKAEQSGLFTASGALSLAEQGFLLVTLLLLWSQLEGC